MWFVRSAIGFTFSQIVLMVQELHVQAKCVPLGSSLRCIIDYGPLHGFWLYAFERYNGLLGAMPHNNHSIEVQIMNRFLRDKELFSEVLPDEFSAEFQPLFPTHMKSSGSLADTLDGHFDGTSGWAIDSPGLNVELPQHCSRQIFDHTQIDFLMELYTDLYKVSRSALVVKLLPAVLLS